jgi:hypothetical protein
MSIWQSLSNPQRAEAQARRVLIFFRRVPGGYRQAYAGMIAKVATEILQKANDIHTDNIVLVRDTIKEYYDTNGILPEDDEDWEIMRTYLAKKLPPNPYTSAIQDPNYKKVNETSDAIPEILYIRDYGLNETALENAAKIPPDKWTAKPGSIMVVSNGNGLQAVLGMGADSRPLRREDTKDVLLLKLKAHP